MQEYLSSGGVLELSWNSSTTGNLQNILLLCLIASGTEQQHCQQQEPNPSSGSLHLCHQPGNLCYRTSGINVVYDRRLFSELPCNRVFNIVFKQCYIVINNKVIPQLKM